MSFRASASPRRTRIGLYLDAVIVRSFLYRCNTKLCGSEGQDDLFALLLAWLRISGAKRQCGAGRLPSGT